MSPLATLTPRQLEVLAMLGEGLPNKLIARRLDISGGTVKVHVVHILRALKVSSRLQAVLVARGVGFEGLPDTRETVQPVKAMSVVAPSRINPSAMRAQASAPQTPCLLTAFANTRLDTVAS